MRVAGIFSLSDSSIVYLHELPGDPLLWIMPLCIQSENKIITTVGENEEYHVSDVVILSLDRESRTLTYKSLKSEIHALNDMILTGVGWDNIEYNDGIEVVVANDQFIIAQAITCKVYGGDEDDFDEVMKKKVIVTFYPFLSNSATSCESVSIDLPSTAIEVEDDLYYLELCLCAVYVSGDHLIVMYGSKEDCFHGYVSVVVDIPRRKEVCSHMVDFIHHQFDERSICSPSVYAYSHEDEHILSFMADSNGMIVTTRPSYDTEVK